MNGHKKSIGIVIYANPDDYPPILNAISLLYKEFDIVVISRNQNKTEFPFSDNVRLIRLGKLKTSREKELQAGISKILEHLSFMVFTVFYIRFYHCRIIYSYDLHGFLVSFIASRFGKRIPLVYHNLEVTEFEKNNGLNRFLKYLECCFARHTKKIVFPDINRARLFQQEARLAKLPDIVMNTPLRINQLPLNKLQEVLQSKGFDTDTRVIFYQGAIADTHYLFEILHSLVFLPREYVLVLIGYHFGDFAERLLQEAQELGLIGRLIVMPCVPYSELGFYTIGASVGLALYQPKNFSQKFNAGASNKIFEYLACGIPAVINDTPYFREVIDSSVAYFVNPDSVENIAEVINSVFSNKEEYLRKRQIARHLHLTKYNYEEQFKPVVEYIRELANRNGK